MYPWPKKQAVHQRRQKTPRVRCWPLAVTAFSPLPASVASTERSSQTRQLASVKTPMQIEQTRIGLFDLRAELTTLRERGLSNLLQLGVIDLTCFTVTCIPLACAARPASCPTRISSQSES
jgi:hypothetical protein